MNSGNDIEDFSKNNKSKYWFQCPNGHLFESSPFGLLKKNSKGCSFCHSLKIPSYNIADKIVIDKDALKLDFNELWKDQINDAVKEADQQMFQSFADRRIQSLILRALDKNKSLKTMPKKLETEEELYQSKVDLSQTALKRFEKSLDSSQPHLYKRNMEIISEIKFVGSFTLIDKWHTLVIWKQITDPKIIRKFVPNYVAKDGDSYISAVVFPRGNEKPISKFYKSNLSDAELNEAPIQSSAFDKEQFGISPTEKTIMMEFSQAEGLSWNFNDDEYGIGEFSLFKKDRIQVNSIQERFAYVRQHLCGVSQNSFAEELKREQGINIDQKGVKYWETHQTEYPSFLKNHWDDILDTMTELSYNLLNTPMTMSLNAKFKEIPNFEDMDFGSVRMFLEDFILYGTNDKTRFDIPDLILNTTAPVKSMTEMDYIWQREKLKSLTQVKTKAVSEEEVAEDSSWIRLWFDILLNKQKSEILSDLDDFYDSDDLKKQVFYIWFKVNEQYDQERDLVSEKQNEGIKPPFN